MEAIVIKPSSTNPGSWTNHTQVLCWQHKIVFSHGSIVGDPVSGTCSRLQHPYMGSFDRAVRLLVASQSRSSVWRKSNLAVVRHGHVRKALRVSIHHTSKTTDNKCPPRSGIVLLPHLLVLIFFKSIALQFYCESQGFYIFPSDSTHLPRSCVGSQPRCLPLL